MFDSHDSSDSVGSTSTGLLLGVKAHDGEAWKRFVRLYGPLIAFWIQRTGLQPADAGDVLQEVLHAVARGINRFEKDGGTFRGWLRTITRSKVADHFRHAKGTAAGEGGSDAYERILNFQETVQVDDDESEANALRLFRLRALEMIRGEFEPKTWQAFWRVTVDGQLAADVAADLDVTPSSVRLSKSRVLRRLREELGQIDE